MQSVRNMFVESKIDHFDALGGHTMTLVHTNTSLTVWQYVDRIILVSERFEATPLRQTITIHSLREAGS